MNKNKKSHTYNTGDWVKINNISGKTGNKRKVINTFSGPYIVADIRSETNLRKYEP